MHSDLLNRGVHVPAGKDLYQEDPPKIWGLIPLTTKVSTQDSGGNLYVFEHADMGKGGPPRHVHFHQDEWFYVLKGEFAFQIGEEAFRLTAGHSVFAPRLVPHAWACVRDPGTLLTLVSPAGTFETFLRETTRHRQLPLPDEVARAFAAHDMEVVGPPLPVD